MLYTGYYSIMLIRPHKITKIKEVTDMKRFIAFILSIIMVALPLIACSEGEPEDTGTGAVSGTETEAPASSDGETDETDPPEDEPEYYGYLFAYFTGNAPEQERICFALSRDGYKYKAINNGKPVVISESGTKCVRDPYIFKGEDGYYYMLATDMKSSLGWASNRHLISWKSEDLINWTDETIIEIDGAYKVTKNTTRAWAPQAIWDPERQEYMIYFALQSAATKGRTIMYYAYSKDMKTLTTEPEVLFAPTNGHDAIDADIIWHDGLYYMFVKDETSGGILLTTSEKLNSGYSYTKAKLVSPPGLAVEGSSTYKLIDGSGWLLITDAYGAGYFTMAHSTDLKKFDQLDQSEFRFNFTPRHGSVIPVTKEQYEALRSAKF